jgi:hypothetical protein
MGEGEEIHWATFNADPTIFNFTENPKLVSDSKYTLEGKEITNMDLLYTLAPCTDNKQ